MSLSTPFLDSSFSSSKGVKRKWSLRDGSTDLEAELPFCHSSSSSDSKTSSATMSSPKESDEESSSMDLELDFTLHLGHEKITPLKKKPSSFDKTSFDNKDQVNLELTLSSSTPTSSITSLSVITQQQQERIISTNICQYNGCEKQTRGVSGHCTKSAEGRTIYCIAHGGSRRCNHEGCTRATTGQSGLCIRHGYRCQMANCTKSAKCQYISCTKGAQGGTVYCKGHGGGKRCKFEGCGRSAQGSTDFCKVHGALVKDERVHGGATLGPIIHDAKSGPLGNGYEDMNVDVNVVTSSRASEGRVHGGSLIAFLAGNSVP